MGLALWAASASGHELAVVNVSDHQLADHPVAVQLRKLPQGLRVAGLKVTDSDGNVLVSQVDDLDGDGTLDELAFFVDLPAQGARRLLVRPAPQEAGRQPAGEVLAFRLWNSLNLENPHLRLDIPAVHGSHTPKLPDVPTAFAPSDTFTVRDRRTGETLLRLTLASDAQYLLEDAGQHVVSGPVRSVARRSRWVTIEGDEERRLRIDEAFVLYERDRRVELRIGLTNLGDVQEEVPAGLLLLDGEMGDVLVRNLGQVQRVRHMVLGQPRLRIPQSSHKSNRGYRLWLNPSTGTGLAYVPHRPRPSGWDKEAVGRDYMRFAPGPGKRIRLSDIADRELAPGETKSFCFTFVLYRGPPQEIMDRYLRDVDAVPGVVTVFGEKEEVLEVAAEPLYMADGTANLARWARKTDTNVTSSDQGILIECPAGGGLHTPFARDFRSPTELRGTLQTRSANTALQVDVEHLASGKVYTLGKVAGGHFQLSLSEKVPFEGVEECLLHLRPVPADGRGGPDARFSVRIRQLALGWPLPPAPTLEWPRQGQELSDVGVSFTMVSKAPESGYEIQVAEDKDFENLVLDERAPKDVLSKEASVTKHIPGKSLAKGTYYWRVRPVSVCGHRGEWTDARSFVVDSTDRPRRPPIRPISPRRPVLFGIGLKKDDARRAFVEKLKAYPKAVADVMVEQRGFDPEGNYPLPAMLHFDNEVDLPQLEYAYRNFPQVIGMCFREKGFSEEYLPAVLALSAKYGRYVSTLQMGKDILQRNILSEKYYPLMKDYGQYFLPQHKMNNRREPMVRALTEIGAYLTGRVGNWGIETEWGYAWKPMSWERRLKPEMITRPLNWMPTLVFGLSTGASLYRIEGLATNHHCFGFTRKGEHKFGPLWFRAIGPFLEDITRYSMIPTREEVLRNVKVALAAKEEYGLHRPSCPDTLFPNRTLAALHGLPIEGVPVQHIFEGNWVPDSSAFYVVPVLPSFLPAEDRKLFDRVIEAEDFATPEDAVRFVSQLYPPSTSEAYAVLVGDTAVAINSIDERRDPRSGTQRFLLDLTKGPVKSIGGTLYFQAYLLMKQMDDALFIHANNFQEQYTSLLLRSRDGQQLHIEVTPPDALTREAWDGGVRELAVTLNHFHGVARVLVSKEQRR